MRILLSHFGQFKAELDALIKDKQSKAQVGKDWQGEIMGKKVKLYLPSDIREQYKALLYAETFSLAQLVLSLDNEKIYENRMNIFDIAVNNMLVEGSKDFNVNAFDVDFIDSVIAIYVTELLLPLYHRSSTKAESELKRSLGKYTIKQ